MAKDSDKLIADQAKQIASLKKQIASQQAQEAAEQGEIIDYTKDLIALDKQRLDYLREIRSYNDMIVGTNKEIRKISGETNKNKRKALRDLRDEAKEAIKIARASEQLLSNEKKVLTERKKQAEIAKEIRNIEDKYGDQIEKSLGFLDTITDTIESIPVVGGILSKALGVDDLKERLAKDLTKSFATTLQGATKGAGGLKTALIGAFKGGAAAAKTMLVSMGPLLPIAIALAGAVMLLKKGFELDQETTDLARNLAISKDEARGIHAELMTVAATTKVVGANTAELTKSYMELASGLGSAKLVTKELAETQVLLTKSFGLAGEEATAFQKMSMVSGKTAEQNVAAIKGITDEMTGGMMNYKEVMKDVAGTSKAVQATFKGNIGKLTEAVITAKKFGKTLDEVKSITDGLLDIEGSLEKEMQARVLTGKDMNFDLARTLKLKGDEAGAMKEVMKQAGSYSELMAMAPYQQEATAEAAGMTVDQLIKGAEHQKLLNDMAKDLGITLDENGKMSEADLQTVLSIGDAEAKNYALNLQQAAAQEKLTQLGDKLAAVFGNLAGPVMEIIDPFIELVDLIMPAIGPLLKIAFAPIMIVIEVVKSIIKLLTGDFLGAFKGLGSGLNKSLSFFAPSDNTKEAANTPTKKQNDAMIGADGGLIVSGARGTYQLASDDTVIAGTNLSGSSVTNNQASTPTTTNTDMAELIVLMKQLVASVKQPAIVQIGNKAVTEIDRIQSMNRSYVGNVDNSYGAV